LEPARFQRDRGFGFQPNGAIIKQVKLGSNFWCNLGFSFDTKKHNLYMKCQCCSIPVHQSKNIVALCPVGARMTIPILSHSGCSILFQLPIGLEAKSTVMLEACSSYSWLWVIMFVVIDLYLEP
jgi:hypothetical protein